MPDNILWSLTGKILLEKVADDYKRETPVSFELREGTIHANPDFTDLSRGVLSPDSPALKLGIQPLDLETVGRLAQPSGTSFTTPPISTRNPTENHQKLKCTSH
jgi:hypothetical protein